MKEMEEGYSDFCREAIIDKVKKEFSEEYLKNKRKELQDSIKMLDQQLKSQKENTGQVREILESGLKGYINRNSEVLIGASQNRLWIRGSVVPKLKKAGSRLSEYDVLKMFEEGKIDV